MKTEAKPRKGRVNGVALVMILLVATLSSLAATPTAASAQQDRLLFDFSQPGQRFWTYAKPGTGAEISGVLNSGNMILRTALPTARSVAWAGKDPTVTDWRGHDALKFGFRGLNTGRTFKIVFQEGADLERFEYTFRDSSSAVRTITAHLKDFTPSNWQPNGQPPERKDLVDIRKFFIQVRGPGSGRIAIGDISLVSDPRVIRTGQAINRPNLPDERGGGLLQLSCTGDRNFAFRSIDPILERGVEPTNHQHMFVGNQEITSRSVNVGGGRDDINTDSKTTCPGGQANLSGYWVPTLSDGRGNRMVPNDVNIYYKRGSVDTQAIENPPTGLKIIAGDLPGTATPPGGHRVAYWTCRGGGQDIISATIPSCVQPGILRMFVVFPQCWDGRTLFAEDGRHMAYANAFGGGSRTDSNGVPYYRECDSDNYPITLPEVTFQFHYNMQPGQNSRNWRLSSPTLHGDWMNGWHRETFQMVIDNCFKAEALQCRDQLSRTVQLID